MPEIQLRGGEVDGLWLHYLVEGRGPAVILVHGLGGFAESWRHNVASLAARTTVYTLDLPGFGRSAKPRTRYRLPYFARALHGFMDALAIPQASLVGHSFGGAVAVTYALTHPARVERLALLSAVVPGFAYRLSWMFRLLALEGVGETLSLFGCARLYRAALARCFHEPLAEEVEFLVSWDYEARTSRSTLEIIGAPSPPSTCPCSSCTAGRTRWWPRRTARRWRRASRGRRSAGWTSAGTSRTSSTRGSSTAGSPSSSSAAPPPGEGGDVRVDTVTEISPQELKGRLAGAPRPLLLDVRQDWETRLCRLENSVHIPIEEIEMRTEELNPGDEIVVYCHQGVRSAAVAEYLRQLGFNDVKNLAGGLDHWARAVDPGMRRY
jgi:pimeloyl-ACP methyl ester carboxylesterase